MGIPEVAIGRYIIRPDLVFAVRSLNTVAVGVIIISLGAEVQGDQRVLGGLVDVLAQADELHAELPGVLARQVHVIGQVQVGADPVIFAGSRLRRGTGPVGPSGGVLQVGRDGIVQRVAGDDVSAAEGPAGARHELLLVVDILVEIPAAQADQEVVRRRVVDVGVARPVGIVEPGVLARQDGVRPAGDPGVVLGADAVGRRDRAPVLAEVVDIGQGHAQALERLRRQLGLAVPVPLLVVELVQGTAAAHLVDVRGLGHGGIDGRVAREKAIRIGAGINGVEGGEEPQAILEDEAAQVEYAFIPVVGARTLAGRRRPTSIIIITIEVLGYIRIIIGIKAEGAARFALHPGLVVVVVAEQVAVELVAARTADDVDDAAHRAAEFGAVAGRGDLHLFQLFHDDALGLGSKVDVGDVRSVDVEHVLAAGGAVDRQAAFVGIDLDAGNRAQQAVEIAAAGQLHERFLGHRAALGGRLDVDQRALADDRDFLGQRALLQGDVERQGLLELKHDVFALDRLEALQAEHDGVNARGQGEQAIRARLVGDRNGLADQLGTRGFDGYAGERSSLVILHFADDLAGRGLGRRKGDEEHDREQRNRKLFHAQV